MPSPLKPRKHSYTVYFAGPLFDLKQLVGNAYLAEAIYERSQGRFLCRLPQDFAPRSARSHRLRDQAIRALFSADLALFNFDGPEVASDTVMDFMLAKAADLPAVVLRTDARGAHSSRGRARDPWTALANLYPRTVTVRVDSTTTYRRLQQTRLRRVRDDVVRLAGQHASATAAIVCDRLAADLVRALDRVRRLPPRMPRYLRHEVYQWLALLPGLAGKPKVLRKELEDCLAQKVKKDLL